MDNSPILQVGGEPTIDFKKITFKNIDILIKRLQNLDKIIKVILDKLMIRKKIIYYYKLSESVYENIFYYNKLLFKI